MLILLTVLAGIGLIIWLIVCFLADDLTNLCTHLDNERDERGEE
jgi:hypothetical protein